MMPDLDRRAFLKLVGGGIVVLVRLGPSPALAQFGRGYPEDFNAYLRDELGYDGEREYVPSGGTSGWNWGRQGGGGGFVRGMGTPNVGPDLARAIRNNPNLEVLLVSGLYDLATPYFAAVWSLDHLGLPPELRDNIHRADFAAGHMMYVEESLLPRWRSTLADFILRTSGGERPRTQ